MSVASKELCQELYELSRWGEYGQENVNFWYEFGKSIVPRSRIGHDTVYLNSFPAYDLGYLLRKLPGVGVTHLGSSEYNAWSRAFDKDFDDDTQIFTADTPEDVLAQLAIELHKQGVLPSESSTAKPQASTGASNV